MENASDARGSREGGDEVTGKPAIQPLKTTGHDVAQAGHKRSTSGGFLGSLSFLRPSSRDAAPKQQPSRRDEGMLAEDEESSKRGSSLATALRQTTQGRKRRGSLRKTAMLGTGKLLRERRNSVRNHTKPTVVQPAMSPDALDDETTPRRFSYENESLNSSSDSGWPSVGKLSISTDSSLSHESQDQQTPRVLASPLTSPVEHYASTTTDDDESVSFFRPTTSSSGTAYGTLGLQPLGGASALPRRRSNRGPQNSSLTVVHTPADLTLDEEWDYSETEWWGWVVLLATWIVFVVGMGSCLGVWTWAWDVGETPYAPPELEDDPTLPITGYYPALMVCTAVMAWVWVVVAWVGMKYFRHAKMVGEDG
ncbi:hypothetical protein EJ04DRAFT_532599 [Polyplosphaeria fusca]|uniref:Uncharacterized protein n=1 Tax=Polyplosphaeria fusca TaxID=682080 RepID=A0A9P4R4T8_9PLEO|nr:hypothetical protein EJ04DRAFT_532599 [Polyplosphaeria fusca]